MCVMGYDRLNNTIFIYLVKGDNNLRNAENYFNKRRCTIVYSTKKICKIKAVTRKEKFTPLVESIQNKNKKLEMSESATKILNKKDIYSTEFKWKAFTFLGSLTGISAVIGFSATLAAAKRKDPEFFDRGIMPNIKAPETGAQLALRALKWGTLYAFTGCGLLFYSIWKLSGASDMEEFKIKMGSFLPRIPKNNPPVGRTEFTGLNDLLDYVQHLKGSKDE